jgi:hypothetical protein
MQLRLHRLVDVDRRHLMQEALRHRSWAIQQHPSIAFLRLLGSAHLRHLLKR